MAVSAGDVLHESALYGEGPRRMPGRPTGQRHAHLLPVDAAIYRRRDAPRRYYPINSLIILLIIIL